MDFKTLLMMAIATSIDALAVGVTFGLDPTVAIVPSALTIGLITFLISFGGVAVGNLFCARWRGKAQAVGGVMLILVGLKILRVSASSTSPSETAPADRGNPLKGSRWLIDGSHR